MKRIAAITLLWAVILSVCSFSVTAADTPTSDSYGYSNSQKPIIAPDSFTLSAVVSEKTDPDCNFSELVDIEVYNDKLYALDKKNGSITVIDSEFHIADVICKDLGLKESEGFFISNSGFIYIADTQNGRILKTDINGNLITVIGEPNQKKTLSNVPYRPSKLVVDGGERIYVIVNSETSGIYQLDINGNFLGFFGSVPVVPSIKELFWRSISTKEQLSRMLLFVPTEYSGMDIDSNGFIYTTVATNTASEIASFIKNKGSDRTVAPIRMLNPKNIDVLKRSGSMPPAGDTVTVASDSVNDASRFIDIKVRNDGLYCALDKTLSRVFTYDDDGNLLYIFGNRSDKIYDFNEPSAICWWGDNIAVADKGNNAIKIFAPTEYAKKINLALKAQKNGDYDTSKELWIEILNVYSGSDIAYLGLGKQELRNGNYSAAMKYFKKADNVEYYSKAFKLQRKQVGTKYTGIVVFLLILATVVYYFIKKHNKKKSVKQYSEVVKGFKYGFYIMRHPFDGFWDMQFENRGNMKSATIILSLATVFNLINCFATGYIVAGNRSESWNILLEGVLSVLLPFGLWCVANWSVTSLMNGSGTFKYIYMYSCYALMPFLIGMPMLILLSRIISLEEIALYTIIRALLYIWMGLLVFAGTLVVHQFGALRTTATIITVIIAMGIIVFLFLLCSTVIQQFTQFIGLLVEEIKLRA